MPHKFNKYSSCLMFLCGLVLPYENTSALDLVGDSNSPYVFEKGSAQSESVWTPDSASEPMPLSILEKLRQTPPRPMAKFRSIEKSAAPELENVRKFNRTGVGPRKNGIPRKLRSRSLVSLGAGSRALDLVTESLQENQDGSALRTQDGDLVWSAAVEVEGSYRLRMHLKQVDISDGVQIWVYNDSGEIVGPFGLELVDDVGEMWTPSVSGPSITIAVLVPFDESVADFEISDVLEIFPLDSFGQPILQSSRVPDLACMEETQCVTSSTFSSIEEAETSVALIFYVKGGESYMCSGGLITDTDESTTIPYFLTANHCIDNQTSATSLEAHWDYKPKTCGGAIPSLSSVPVTYGSTLMATGTVGDFTLLKLNSTPSGTRWFMGWNANKSALTPGTALHRISHPAGSVQHYSQTATDGGTSSCISLPRASFIYQSQVFGGITGGSSGSPVYLDNGQIVGQLYGSCGDDIGNACDYSNLVVDGSLSTYWSSVSQYLDTPNATPAVLTVSKSGSGSGTVTSNPAGINCGSDCTEAYASGTNVNLSASPASGSTFGGWSGSCSGTDSCNVSMSQARSVTARFNTSTTNYALSVSKSGSGSGTVASNPSGINCGSTCSANFSSGTSVILSANPASGSTFGGWSGSCSGNGTCNVSMSQARSVTANFQSSGATVVTNVYSGLWKNPAQTGHGFSISVHSATRASVYWYTYDLWGNPIWILGEGQIVGNKIKSKAWYFQGMEFGTWDPADRRDYDWGTFEIEFHSCDSATFTYDSTLVYDSGEEFGSGTFPIARLASIDKLKCGDAGSTTPVVTTPATDSGLWKNPAQTGHGFSVSVHSATRASVYWYTYDPFGTPIWILGEGQIVGNKIKAKAWFFYGMKFGTWDPASRQDYDWGTFEIEFHSCDSATFTYDSTLFYESGEEYGSGTFPITRLASISGLDCQ